VYIRQLRVDQFGACADFEIASLAPGLTVIHGPRGAGKSTLTAFLQGALYGYDTPLAAHFLCEPTADAPASQAFRVTRDGSSWHDEASTPRRNHRPLGGSLSLALSSVNSPQHDRLRDTRLLARHRHGDAERLRFSRPASESDFMAAGATLSDGENATLPLDPAAINALYAGLPPRFLAELFVLDFQRTTRLGALLEQAERCGTPLVDNAANPLRIAELEGELAKAREQRVATTDPGATPETLAERRSSLRNEIAELESRVRRQHDSRARWRRQLATLAAALERQLSGLSRDIQSLDATLATLVERRRQLAATLRPATRSDLRSSNDTSDPADPVVRHELQKLDEQLERWRRTLGELITAKGHAAELAEASDRMLAATTPAASVLAASALAASTPAANTFAPGIQVSTSFASDAWTAPRRPPGALFGLADAELAGLPAGDPLRRLAEVEASTFAIGELLAKTQTLLRDHAPPLVAAELSAAFERHHQSLRGHTRHLAESLSGWRHWITKRAAADEQQQLLRSEIEFRRAIAALEERRQKLLGKAVDPAALPASAHSDTLDECQRLMERRDQVLRHRQEVARQLADAQRLLADHDATLASREQLVDGSHRESSPRPSEEPRLNSIVLADLDPQEIGAVDLDPAVLDRQLRELRTQAIRLSQGLTGSVECADGESLASVIETKRVQLLRLESDQAAAERRRELASRCEELDRQLADERGRRVPHPVLREASEFLAELTDGRLPRIARDSRGYLRVSTADGGSLEWDTLTEAAQDQVALAMHLALARDFRRRGVQLPLVINEPFTRYADREVAAAVPALQRLADQVQILCFTGDERAARAARHAGVALGWLRVNADGRPALFDSGTPAAATVNALARAAERDPYASARASWGVRRPHAWDSEEFPGELADRRRFTDESPPELSRSKRTAAKNEPGKPVSVQPPSANAKRGDLGDGPFELGDFENAEFAAAETPPRYLLNRSELAAHAPSITGLLAQRLEDRGVRTVGDLLAVNADTLAVLLGDVSAKAIRGWQTQAELACRVPGLRATDCRILAALQIGSVEKLAALKPAELWKRVSQATDSGDWDRLAPGVAPPDPATISNWIHGARRARSLAAA
jgi:hypothetical protein